MKLAVVTLKVIVNRVLIVNTLLTVILTSGHDREGVTRTPLFCFDLWAVFCFFLKQI